MKISGFAIAAIVGLTAVPLSLSPAKAQAILGDVSLVGTDVTNASSNSIAFNPFAAGGLGVGVAQVTVAEGNLASVFTPLPFNVGMIGAGATLNYTVPSQWVGQKLFGSTPEDFTINTFASSVSGTGLTLSGTGTFGGSVNTPGTWTLTTQLSPGGGFNTTTFSAEAFSVPGPIVGAGLPGLIAALGGLVAMARRRRNQLA